MDAPALRRTIVASHRALRIAAMALPTALLLGACSEATSPSPNAPAVDVAGVVSNASLLSVERMAASVSGGVADTTATSGFSGCAYSAASARFVCPTVTANGLTMMTAYVLLNAAGQPQSSPDAATIDAIRTIRDVAGTLPLVPGFGVGATAVTEHEDQTISGLLAGHLVLNGTGTTTITDTLTLSGILVPMTSQRTETIANVTLPSAVSGSAWPTGGSITTVTTVPGVSGAINQTTMTFDPSGNVTMVITTGTISRTCHLSLAVPATALGCS